MKRPRTILYTTVILAIFALFTLGCAGHNHSNYKETNSYNSDSYDKKGYDRNYAEQWPPWEWDWSNSE